MQNKKNQAFTNGVNGYKAFNSCSRRELDERQEDNLHRSMRNKCTENSLERKSK